MENPVQGKSKTQMKKEAEELQELGVELSRLSSGQLERLKLPEALHKALVDARFIKSNIAARRQRQYIGTLMRDVDPEPIFHALQEIKAELPIESETEKETRMWRDRLLTGDPAAMEAFIHAFPGMERQRLRQLLRNIKKEKAAGKSLKTLEQLIMKRMNHR